MTSPFLSPSDEFIKPASWSNVERWFDDAMFSSVRYSGLSNSDNLRFMLLGNDWLVGKVRPSTIPDQVTRDLRRKNMGGVYKQRVPAPNFRNLTDDLVDDLPFDRQPRNVKQAFKRVAEFFNFMSTRGMPYDSSRRLYRFRRGSRADWPESLSSRISVLRESFKEDIKPAQANKVVDLMNSHAFQPIKNVKRAAELIEERMNVNKLQDNLWNSLSNNKDGGKYFQTQRLDPTMGIVFVNTSFLVSKRGNALSQHRKDGVQKILDAGQKFTSVPMYDLKTKSVEEGNHRVWALSEKGVKSIPVLITGGWD